MIQAVFLEGEQRLSFRRKFGNEGAAGIHDEYVAEGIRGDSGWLLQLAWPIACGAPLADKFQGRALRAMEAAEAGKWLASSRKLRRNSREARLCRKSSHDSPCYEFIAFDDGRGFK